MEHKITYLSTTGGLTALGVVGGKPHYKQERMNIMEKLYIAYGSNMDEEQMKYRCPSARLIGKSVVEDYQLLFKGSKTGAYATIEPKNGSQVPALLWTIGERDERNLDRYEGCPSFYYKQELEIEVGGRRAAAMVYIMHEENQLGIPSQRYYSVILKAYRKFGFDVLVVEQALLASSAPVTTGENRERLVRRLRMEYPAGCRVELLRMLDPQAPVAGTKGTVMGVDDIGNIFVKWDSGSSLNLVYGIDLCRKVEGDKLHSIQEE